MSHGYRLHLVIEAEGPALTELQESSQATGAGRPYLAIAQSVIAQSVFFIGLLYFYGWTYERRYYEYFGLPSGSLGLNAAEFMLSGGFVLGLALLAAGGVIYTWVYWYPHGKSGVDSPSARWWTFVLGVSCVLTMMFAASTEIFMEEDSDYKLLFVSASNLATLILLTTYLSAGRQRSRISGLLAERLQSRFAVVLLVAGIMCILSIAPIGGGLGRLRAAQDTEDRSTIPAVIIYSKEDLRIDRNSVKRSVFQTPDSRYTYRYDGFLLLARRSGMLYLIEKQHPREGVLMIAEDESIRIETRREAL